MVQEWLVLSTRSLAKTQTLESERGRTEWTLAGAAELVRAWKRLLLLDPPSEYTDGSELFAQGSIAREVFLLKSGVVKLTSTQADGGNTILGLRYPGKWVEQCAWVLEVPYPVSATTLTRCEIYRFDARRFRNRLDNSVEAFGLLVREQAHDYYDQAEALMRLKTLNARQRVEYFLAEFVPPTSFVDKRNPGRIRIPLKDHEIAALIGVSKQHFSILKRQMIEAGEIVTDSDYPSSMTVTEELYQKCQLVPFSRRRYG
jgi:CRP-like cAMP-binding protein